MGKEEKATMSDEALRDYVRKYASEKYTFDEIRSALLDQDCDLGSVNDAIALVRKELEAKASDKTPYMGIVTLVFTYLVALLFFYYTASRTGLSGSMLYSPFANLFALLDGNLDISLVHVILACVCVALAFGAYMALQFKKTSLRTLYLLPVAFPVYSLIFLGLSRFALVASISVAGSLFYQLLDVEKRKEAYKKILVHEISSLSLDRCFFPAFIIIASFVGFATFEDSSYREAEISRIFVSAGLDAGNVETLHAQLEERQLANNYLVLETVENALLVSSQRRMSTTCSAELDDALSAIDTDARAQLQEKVRQGTFMDPEQVKKMESLTDLVGNMRRFYPILAGVYALMVFELLKKLLAPLASLLAYGLTRVTS